jgi:hypothetical protein
MARAGSARVPPERTPRPGQALSGPAAQQRSSAALVGIAHLGPPRVTRESRFRAPFRPPRHRSRAMTERWGEYSA